MTPDGSAPRAGDQGKAAPAESPDQQRQREAFVRTRRAATGLLALMAATFATARWLEPGTPALGYVAAFAEAGLVGGLADWFAVTALFRHPLGLPVPHTAIIPRNKDRIGRALGRFLETHFLTPENVAQKLAGVDLAAAAARWLARPENTERTTREVERLLAELLAAVDGDEVRDFVRRQAGARLAELDVAALAGRLLNELAAEDAPPSRLLDDALRRLHDLLLDNEDWVRERIRERLGRVWQWLDMDERAFRKLVEGLESTLDELAEDPDHPLRRQFGQLVADFGRELQASPDWRARGQALMREVVERPAVQERLGALWDGARDAVLAEARDPASPLRARIARTLAALGRRLQDDDALRGRIDAWLRDTLVALVESNRERIAALIPDTVARWDTATLTGRLELLVGRDLQYVRINGTLVGGLVGLALHALTHALQR